uniref:Uncharacterized protein n=1 Tax=uncultured bacterium fosmid pJB16B1 TaxID=1478054 RepID=A0A0H3U9F9_9BACT|nr:hypothetical protein [uncultured bacterium fosmid pJB16B1]
MFSVVKCPQCGEPFVQVNTNQIYCSRNCCAAANRGRCPKKKAMKKTSEHERMKARLEERDAAYAKAFPAQASGSTRGRRVVASKCGIISDAAGFVRKYIG